MSVRINALASRLQGVLHNIPIYLLFFPGDNVIDRNLIWNFSPLPFFLLVDSSALWRAPHFIIIMLCEHIFFFSLIFASLRIIIYLKLRVMMLQTFFPLAVGWWSWNAHVGFEMCVLSVFSDSDSYHNNVIPNGKNYTNVVEKLKGCIIIIIF